MGTTFWLWSASGAAAQEGQPSILGAGGVYLPHGAEGTVMPPAMGRADLEQHYSGEQLAMAQEGTALRASKKKKQAAPPKRPPQRGLGVEKLERLRLQERWRKMTEIDPQADEQQMQESPRAGAIHQQQQQQQQQQLMLHYAVGAQCQPPRSPFAVSNGFPVYDPQHQAGVSRVSLARFAAAPPAPGGYGAGAWGESCFLQRHSVLGAGRFLGNCGTISAIRPAAFQDNSGVDLFRIGTADARFQVTGRPSVSQRLQCPDECDICIRKRMLERRLWTNCGIGGSSVEKKPLCLFGAADWKYDHSPEGNVSPLEVKEYEFFPTSSSNTSTTITTSAYPAGGWSGGGDDAALGTWNNVGAVPSTTSSASACSSKQLDLTLKLSL